MAQIMTKRKFVFDVCLSFGRAQFLESFKPLLKCLLIHNQKHMYLFLFLAGILGIMLKPKVFLYNIFNYFRDDEVDVAENQPSDNKLPPSIPPQSATCSTDLTEDDNEARTYEFSIYYDQQTNTLLEEEPSNSNTLIRYSL